MRLVCTRGSTKSQEWEITETTVSFGRDPLCTIVLQDPKASRIHCEIRRSDGQFVLVDRNSTNGTYVNGSKVGRHVLTAGDVILVGATEFRVTPTSTFDEVKWEDEANPSITLTIPVESMARRLQEAGSPPPESLPAKPAPTPPKRDSTSTLIRTKLLNHLHIIYELSQNLSRIMALDDLYNHLSETMFRIFNDVERICIVMRGEEGNFLPITVRSRHGDRTEAFTISNAIFEQAIQQSVGILAFDALSDTRFRQVQSVASLNIRSVMCAPLVSKGEAIGALYVDNRTRENCFGQEDLELLTSIAAQAANAIQNSRLYDNLQRAYHQIILSLINAIEAKDPYTYGHHKRVNEYANGIGREMNLSPEGLDRLNRASELHDIGKIGIHEQLIHKPTSLTDSEILTFQAHVVTGEKILRPLDNLQDVLPVIRQHHEHFNGQGYPDQLAGEQILIEARILAVADSFDAMTTQRTYNRPVTFSMALKRCQERAGTQFDPGVIEALRNYLYKCHSEKMQEPEMELPAVEA
jgi:HD-GYP domain-containing protein (c-di-GMP phosphodiesterase class II)